MSWGVILSFGIAHFLIRSRAQVVCISATPGLRPQLESADTQPKHAMKEAVAALEAVVANRNSPQKHVWRAKIMRATGKAKTVIWRWQERFPGRGRGGALARQNTPLAHSAVEP
jgi:hypothetical protein